MVCKLLFMILIGYVHAAIPQHCSEFLVSGLYGVDDSALTSTRTHKDYVSGADFYPKNSRLYSDAPTLEGSAGWCSHGLDTHQYLQIEFSRETIINAAIIQGRGDYAHYVMSYYLLYSIDGVTWTTVTTAGGNPKVFPGNSDSHTPVTTAISPTIIAKYIRVNPRTWIHFICFRFDLSGCRPLEQDAGFKSLKFKKTSVTIPTQLSPYQILQQVSSSLLDCLRVCCTNDQCQSFTFSSTGHVCNMYSRITTTTLTPSVGGLPYYYSTALTDDLNYKPNQYGVGLYKVNEIHMDQPSASDTCHRQYSTLMKIESSSQMSYLQGIISGNRIMSRDFRFYVSGQYVTEWRYGDGTLMTDTTLWSPSQPNPSHGSCVMLTQTGLSSVVCSQSLFSICRH